MSGVVNYIQYKLRQRTVRLHSPYLEIVSLEIQFFPEIERSSMDFISSKLPRNVLPTNRDVVNAINFEKTENKKTFTNAIKSVVDDVISVWERTALPHLSKQRIESKMRNYYAIHMKIVYAKQRRSTFVENIQKFKVI